MNDKVKSKIETLIKQGVNFDEIAVLGAGIVRNPEHFIICECFHTKYPKAKPPLTGLKKN